MYHATAPTPNVVPSPESRADVEGFIREDYRRVHPDASDEDVDGFVSRQLDRAAAMFEGRRAGLADAPRQLPVRVRRQNRWTLSRKEQRARW